MPTGYEVDTYRNIARIAAALERIADVLEREPDVRLQGDADE